MNFRVFDTKKKKFVDLEGRLVFLINPSGTLVYYRNDLYKPTIFYAPNNIIPIFSTGLQDKNGKEYEDGSMFTNKNDKGVIALDTEWNNFYIQYPSGGGFFIGEIDPYVLLGLEIIGSKYTIE